jgi:hypothetical protein
MAPHNSLGLQVLSIHQSLRQTPPNVFPGGNDPSRVSAVAALNDAVLTELIKG